MKIEEIALKPEISKAIHDLGFTEFTPIQEQCIPQILQGKDVVGQSSTGSGKTAAFTLPILQHITAGKGLQVLVLTPTRELCVQVSEAVHEFGKYMHVRVASVYGGVGIEPQIHAIRKADIVVGTPGRILDHMQRKTLTFQYIKYLVLDEADRMFDMGFIEDVEMIIHQVPRERQTLLFSATMPTAVRHIVEKHQRHPINITSKVHVEKHLLHQAYYVVSYHDKFSLLVHLLKKHPEGLSIIFCGTRRESDLVSRNLKTQGIKAMAIHGVLTQRRRMDALDALKSEHIHVLVATDVAARGLDIRNVSHVYNYDVPKTSEEYVHRIGRTARAGSEGDAVTLLADRDYQNFDSVLRDRSLEIKREQLPQFEKIRFQREQRGGFRGEHGGRPARGGYGHREESRGRPGQHRREGGPREEHRQGGFHKKPTGPRRPGQYGFGERPRHG